MTLSTIKLTLAMKTLILVLLLLCSLPSFSQTKDSIRLVGHGAMSDFPKMISNSKDKPVRFGFSGYKQDVKLKMVIWKYDKRTGAVEQIVLSDGILIQKENPRIVVEIANNEEMVMVQLTHIGKYTSLTPIKQDDIKKITSYPFMSQPNIFDKITPIMLFAEEQSKDTLVSVLSIEEITGEEDIRKISKKISKKGSFQILTYQLSK